VNNLSVNDRAYALLDSALAKKELLHLNVTRLKNGATIVHGDGFEMGALMVRIKHGDLCGLSYGWSDEFSMPTLNLWTDHPHISIMASYLAVGWRLPERFKGLLGLGHPLLGGPAKALARQPPELFETLDYHDSSEVAVAVLQLDYQTDSAKLPLEELTEFIANDCKVKVDKVYLLLAFNNTLSGLITVLGAVVETGMSVLWVAYHYDTKKVKYGVGTVVIPSVPPGASESMTMINNALMYACHPIYHVFTDPNEDLTKLAESITLEYKFPGYGRSFGEIWKECGHDWNGLKRKYGAYWACPPKVTMYDLRSGIVVERGRMRPDLLRRFMGHGSLPLEAVGIR
jgi:methenyltetrahydromethanopterin cyclohydrolase